MERTVFDGGYLVVEGVTDSRLYGKFLDKDGSRILIAHSKDNVVRVVKDMSRKRNDRKVLAIIDRDLDLLKGKKIEPPLFGTDCRDMEMMLIRSNALDNVLDEYCEAESIQSFKGRRGDIRDALVDAACPVGLLMYATMKNGLRLSFKNIDFSAIVNPRTLSLDVKAMVVQVLCNSSVERISTKQLYRMLQSEADLLDDPWKAARGHDAIGILLVGLRKGFGSFNARYLDDGSLAGALRLAFDDDDFSSTDLYRDTSEWSSGIGVSLWSLKSRNPRFSRHPTIR